MDQIWEKAQEAANFIASKINSKAKIAIGLGTGSGSVEQLIENKISIPYADIPHFPTASVKSHKGELIIGDLNKVPVYCLAGRIHYYEGWSMKELTFPIRVMQALGVQNLILSNASGGLNESYLAGDIILVKDHINLLPEHPLTGHNDERLGIRFPDMSAAYDKRLRELVLSLSTLKEGVYASLQGPSLETPAEYKFLHTIGADLVGMSTVPEVIVANHASIKTMVLSIVTNECFPIDKISETTLEEVVQVAEKSSEKLSQLLHSLVPLI